MDSPHSRARLRALAFVCANALVSVLALGCGGDDSGDASAAGALQGSTAKGGASGRAGGAGAPGSSSKGGAGGQAGSGGETGGDAVPAGGGKAGAGGSSGSAGSEGNKNLAPPGYAGSDAGFCNPTLVVMLPVAADGASDQVAKVQIHADTTSDLLGTATNRYEAICGESDGEDLLVGLDVPETGNLTLSLAAASKGFQGILSVERGICKGTLGATDGCAVAEPGGVAQLSLVVTKGEHLFVFVDTPAGRGGEFNLVATLVPTP